MWLMIGILVAIAVICVIGAVYRNLIFQNAGESGFLAWIPVVKFYTYGKIAGARFFGLAEGIFSLTSWLLLLYGLKKLYVATVWSVLIFLVPQTLPDVMDDLAYTNIILLTGCILLALQVLCRGIVRWRLNARYGVEGAMILLWVFLPHIAEIVLSRKMTQIEEITTEEEAPETIT